MVRDDSATPHDLLFQTSVATYQAYNNWGGRSLYPDQNPNGERAYKVSFNRPYDANTNGAGHFLSGPYWPYANVPPTDPAAPLYQAEYRGFEYNMVRWLEKLTTQPSGGYDVSYCTDVDTHANNIGPVLLARHKAFLSVGHDEYWSKGMRDHVEAARDQGIHLGFFGGNDSGWVIRFDNGQDYQGSTTVNTTVICYKEDLKKPPLDPECYNQQQIIVNNGLCTVEWRTSKRSEFQMIGNGYQGSWGVTASDIQDIKITPTQIQHWVFSGVNLPLDNNDQQYHLKGLLGDEPDSVCISPNLDCGGVPAVTKLTDMTYEAYTGNFVSGTQTLERSTFPANMTLYTAGSGAQVFSTGNAHWAWGLDKYQDPTVMRQVDEDTRKAADQITKNVLNCFAPGPNRPCPKP